MQLEEQFVQLSKDLAPYKELLGRAADTIMEQDVSSYPIFVVHQESVSIGIAVVQRAEGGSKWTIQASTLEELATRRIIGMDKVDDFRSVYKDPAEYLCLFLISKEGARFVFLPR